MRTHLDRFLAATAAATDGAGVPRFIEREFRSFLGCGVLERGFARVAADDERDGPGARRQRTLVTTVWFAYLGPGPHPLVVYRHGYFATTEGATSPGAGT